jgi:hypothetical protein
MELQQIKLNHAECCLDLGRRGVDKKSHARHSTGNLLRNFSCCIGCNLARTVLSEHQPERVNSGSNDNFGVS